MSTMRTLILNLALVLACASQALTVDISIYGHSYCGQNNGALMANVSGGTPPYTIAWSNGPNTAQNFGLVPGTYSVTVTDALLDEATAQADILTLPAHSGVSYNEDGGYCLPELPYVSFYAGTENGLPPDPMTGTAHTPGPYSFDAVGFTENWMELPDACTWFSYYIVSINAPAGTFVTVNFTDGAGCPGTFNTTIKPPIAFPAMQVLNVTGSCSNGAIGSATVSVAPTSQPLLLHLRNAIGAFVPDECSVNWVDIGNDQFTFSNLAPGTYHAVLDCDLYNQFANGTFCTDSLEIIIPDLGTTCGQLNGRVYVDGNANCALNGSENLVPVTNVVITPGPIYATTNGNGQFSVALPFGTYTLTELHPVLDQSCPAVVTISGATTTQNIGCAGGEPLDVQVSLGDPAVRPGFEVIYPIDVDNLTPSAAGTVTLQMTFDPALEYVSASPTPTNVSGNVLTWTAPTFALYSAFQHYDLSVRLHVPPDVGLIGTQITHVVSLVTQNTDADLANNTVSLQQTITGSFDPNDKVARTVSGEQGSYLIDEDDRIDYTIRFQNTGTDTAFTVIITDTLPGTLDPATIIWGATSHACTREVQGQGVIKWVFANILLPDSNVNEVASHGLVSFSIRPYLPIAPGTAIENVANIFFDYNEPVITEPSVLTAEFSTGLNEQGQSGIRLQPNPVNDRIRLNVSDGNVERVRIFTLDGRLVKAFAVRGASAELDVSDLCAGVYLLESEGSAVLRTRFVKQ